MSDELEKPAATDTKPVAGASEQQAAAGDGLDQLMQPDAAAKEKGASLESAAIAAARDAVSAAEVAIDGFQTEVDAAEDAAAQQLAEERAKKRLWMLRGALILNFGLMGLMLAMPSADGPDGGADPHGHEAGGDAHGHQSAGHLPPAPFVEPLRDPRYVIPRDKLYDEALLVARDGNYEDAAVLMQRYIEAHPGVHPSLMQNTYFLMERYLRLAGRIEESVKYGNLARSLVGQSYLPEDLWTAARAAEESGNAREMRKAYARLLLQRSMLTASQLAIVTEAYLKLGDSYRLEANQGEGSSLPPLLDPIDRPVGTGLIETEQGGGSGTSNHGDGH